MISVANSQQTKDAVNETKHLVIIQKTKKEKFKSFTLQA